MPIPIQTTQPHIKPEWLDIARRYPVSAYDIAWFCDKCEIENVVVPDAQALENMVACGTSGALGIGNIFAVYIDMSKQRTKEIRDETASPGIVAADWEE